MDEETLTAIYNAYESGQMLPEEKVEYEKDVNEGVIGLPQGKTFSVTTQQETVTAPQELPQGVFDAYFEGRMTPEESQEFEQDAGAGLFKLPEGVTVSSFEASGDLSTPLKGFKLTKEPTLGEKAIGVGETALTLVTGATGGLVGQIGGTLKGLVEQIVSGKFGTQEAGEAVKQAALEGAQALTYEPTTETGQEYTQAIAETLAPLEALGPLGAEIETIIRGTMAAKTAPKTRPGVKAAEAVKTAERAGIIPMTTDVIPPKTFVGKFAQAVGERIPLVGTGEARAAQQVQRANAIKGFLSEHGAVGTGAVIDDVMSSLTKARENKINRFSKIKGEVFAKMPDSKVNTDSTLNIIDSEILRLKQMGTKGVSPLIDVLNDYKTAFKDKNIANIEALRKQLGDQLDSTDMASVKTESGKSARKIYGALNEDIGDFVKLNGEPKDFAKWKIANRELSATFSELENGTLKSVLKRGNATPEAVKSLLFSQKPSDIKTLYRNLNREGRANARTAILHEAVEKAGGIENFTPERFTTHLKRLQKSTGIFFTGEDKKALNGLSKALHITRRGGIAGVKPTTGAELTTIATPTALTWFLGSDPITGLAATGGVGLMAKIYESKPFRNTLIKIANAPKGKELPLITSLMAIIESQKENQKTEKPTQRK